MMVTKEKMEKYKNFRKNSAPVLDGIMDCILEPLGLIFQQFFVKGTVPRESSRLHRFPCSRKSQRGRLEITDWSSSLVFLARYWS
jgi:hypothetical protein